MKNVSRNKLLLCFRPVVMEVDFESPNPVDCSPDNVLAYIAVENGEKGMKISTVKTSSLSDKDCSKNRSPKRTFSKIVKAVLFQASLSKRARDRKLLQDLCQSTNSNLSNTSSMLSSSSLSSSSFSSSISQSISEKSMPNSSGSISVGSNQKNDNHVERIFMGWSSFNSGLLYLLLISLTVTVLWGKLCAIVFTSIWLYFLPWRRHVGDDDRQSKNVMKLPEMDSRVYKKRIIMEGLLERNHHTAALKF